MIKICAMTEKGNHSENEDRILINDVIVSEGYYEIESDDCIRVCIADGVGGNNGGAVASSFVCEHIKTLDCINRSELIHINELLINNSIENTNWNKMATTLSGIFENGDEISSFHVGNTRIYVFQGNYLKQTTDDHTTVNWLLKTGKITKKDAEIYEKRNEITACFGGGNGALINLLELEDKNTSLMNSKKIILTSDGIHEYVSIDELESILLSSETDNQTACKVIIDRAVSNGSIDDKSIVIINR